MILTANAVANIARINRANEQDNYEKKHQKELEDLVDVCGKKISEEALKGKEYVIIPIHKDNYVEHKIIYLKRVFEQAGYSVERSMKEYSFTLYVIISWEGR